VIGAIREVVKPVAGIMIGGILLMILLRVTDRTPSPSQMNSEVPKPKVLQRHLALHVKASGSEMHITYSGFIDDGRFFVATQYEEQGTCGLLTPDDVEETRKALEKTGSVEPIYLVAYADGQGGSYWEVVQHTHIGDLNFVPLATRETEGEESCGVSVVFHRQGT
jgi:hypothetical protein